MLKWLALWTFFAFLTIGYAAPEWITKGRSLLSHRNRRMINGTLVSSEEPLWQVTIYARRNGDWYYAGSGSIISRNWVITVAHCACNGSAANPNIQYIGAGSTNLWSGHGHWIKHIICHASYTNVVSKSVPVLYDIALISVWRPFELGTTVISVTLPVKQNHIVQSGEISSWGSTRPDGTGISIYLRRIKMKILSEYHCTHFLRNALPNKTEPFGQICGRGLLGGYVCYGDSGSGLVVNGVLEGIASWISEDQCIIENDPTVFTAIYPFRTWIKNVTGV